VARERLDRLDRVLNLKRRRFYPERHKHAMRRRRGPGGRLLTADEVAEMPRAEDEKDHKGSSEQPANSSENSSSNPDSCTAPGCNSIEDLRICLTCANVGCAIHAKQHWAELGHNLTQMAVGRACAWDYQGNSWVRPSDVPLLESSKSDSSSTSPQPGEPSGSTPSKKRAYSCNTDDEPGVLTSATKRVKVEHTRSTDWTSVINEGDEDTMQADMALDDNPVQDTVISDVAMTGDDVDFIQDHVATSQTSVATPLPPCQPPNGHSTCPQCHKSLRRLCELK
jgi:hypothetical protein